MDMATSSPASTYPFVFTTYTNPSPTTESSYPTTYTETSFLPHISADPACASAPAYPSIEGPLGLKAGCVISNAAQVNPHAFWDVYACCPGHDMSAYGYTSFMNGTGGGPGICMMQCSVDDSDGATWQDVGECLQKRVKEVICAPAYVRRNHTEDGSSDGGSQSTSGTASGTASGTVGSATGLEGTGSQSKGAAASVSVAHTGTTKVGVFAFFLLAMGSAAGMLL